MPVTDRLDQRPEPPFPRLSLRYRCRWELRWVFESEIPEESSGAVAPKRSSGAV